MRYPETNDPEVRRIHRMRAGFGVTVLVFFTVGLAGLALTAPPPKPEHLSVNCFELTPSEMPTLSDVEAGRVGCTPAAPERASPAAGARLPAPAPDAAADNPPIATF